MTAAISPTRTVKNNCIRPCNCWMYGKLKVYGDTGQAPREAPRSVCDDCCDLAYTDCKKQLHQALQLLDVWKTQSLWKTVISSKGHDFSDALRQNILKHQVTLR